MCAAAPLKFLRFAEEPDSAGILGPSLHDNRISWKKRPADHLVDAQCSETWGGRSDAPGVNSSVKTTCSFSAMIKNDAPPGLSEERVINHPASHQNVYRFTAAKFPERNEVRFRSEEKRETESNRFDSFFMFPIRNVMDSSRYFPVSSR